MAKKSPKKRARKTNPAPARPLTRVPPPSVKKEPEPADVAARARQSRQDSAEIEAIVWRSIYC